MNFEKWSQSTLTTELKKGVLNLAMKWMTSLKLRRIYKVYGTIGSDKLRDLVMRTGGLS
jgi:hypothetical protein